MAYRYAVTRESYADLSGGVLHSAPGFPAFPARLASEMFQRALAHTSTRAARVWDPCCGSAHLLATVTLLHPDRIAGVLGTDVDPAALELAGKNIGLLSGAALTARAEELQTRAARLGKPAYLDAADAARRLGRRLAPGGALSDRGVAQADVFDPAQLQGALDGRRPDVVITDVPYGEQTPWRGPEAARGLDGMLDSLEEVLDAGTVIAVAARGRKVPLSGGRRPLESFRIGTRAVVLCRVPG